MKILVVSDIHGNLPALEVILKNVQETDILLCAGDLSGYFPFVNEVIEVLASHPNCICVMGNHDAVLLDGRLTTNSFSADLALTIQRTIITSENRSFLASLPQVREIQIEDRTIHLFHGTPQDYLNGRDTYWKDNSLSPGIYVSGHTHIPFYYKNDLNGAVFINPGGAGFPRDGNPQTSFSIIDTADWNVSMCRLPYDTGKVTSMCTAAGLPPHFSRSIESGSWIHHKEKQLDVMR